MFHSAEPDSHRLGWGVAKFSGFLQDLEVSSDKDDSRCLHVTVHKPSCGARGSPVPLLSATFTFDDHIRCMAAKQRLTKGRTKARQRKMHLIAKLLELPTAVSTACPSPPQHTLSSLRAQSGARRLPGNTRGRQPLFNQNLRVPGAATLISREERRAVRKARSPSRDTMEMSGGEIRLEPIKTQTEAPVEPEVEVEEAQEETSFEGGTTWYLDSQSGTDTDSPRGNIHDV